jgi:mRNA interferase HigB
MRILGLLALEEFKKKHADSRGPLEAWRAEVERAKWHTTQDIKKRYPAADFLANNRVIFNIKGNTYRLVVTVRYEQQFVLIDWIGTHAKYSKKRF